MPATMHIDSTTINKGIPTAKGGNDQPAPHAWQALIDIPDDPIPMGPTALVK